MADEKRPVGRPTKLNAKVAERIVKLVIGGNYLETAAASCGVSAQVVRDWMRRGARAAAKLKEGEAPPDSEAPFIVFAEDMSAAMAECETRAVVELRGAGKDDWRASLAFLERKFPKKWGQRIHMHVDEELDAFLSRIESNLDRATFERVLRAANGEISAVPAAQSPGREDRGEGGEPDPDSDAG